MGEKDTSLPERFWAKVDKDGPVPAHAAHLGPCWQWTAARSTNGYGKVGWHGKSCYAHRLVYETLVGPIPTGLEIDHICRNRLCCNPEHLEAVTHAVNRERATQTHCKRGHAFDEANTYVGPNGQRWCRACGAMRARRYRETGES